MPTLILDQVEIELRGRVEVRFDAGLADPDDDRLVTMPELGKVSITYQGGADHMDAIKAMARSKLLDVFGLKVGADQLTVDGWHQGDAETLPSIAFAFRMLW